MSAILEEINNTLSGLKDFQRATVDKVMELFATPGHNRRVLVADEVGLGKTIVAKGVIATLLKDWQENRPLRVTYICSNLALAAENQRKLSIFKGDSQTQFVKEPSFHRLAELALIESDEGQDKKLEVCTLTPATSFSLTQGFGNMRERAIIFEALMKLPELAACREGLEELFRNGVGIESWRSQQEWVASRNWSPEILAHFHESLSRQVVDESQSQAVTWLAQLRTLGSPGMVPTDGVKNRTLRTVRLIFVKCCAANLRADLFILDEFQRFKSLIETDEENEQTLIAQQVFSKARDVNMLLLSATPFKAMTTLEEDETDEAHLIELRKVLSFLNMNAPLANYERARQDLQSQLLSLKQGGTSVADLKDDARRAIETELRPLICRTERAQIAKNVDDVLKSPDKPCGEQFGPLDIDAYKAIDGIASHLEGRGKLGAQLVEFYKSAAWALSFANGYILRDVVQRYATAGTDLHKHLMRSKSYLWIPKQQITDYKLKIAEQAPNAKVRELTRHLLGTDKSGGPEMLLWVPPSMPHYALAGSYASHSDFSKTLIFSAWAMVPRMLSGLLSYEAERRVLGNKTSQKYFDKQKHNPVLHFDGKNTLASWALVYPSKLLVDMELVRTECTLEDLLCQRAQHFEALLPDLKRFETDTRIRGDNWYALAPLLLDRAQHAGWTESWFQEQKTQRCHSVGRLEKLKSLEELLLESDLALGKMPKDLAHFLALLSVASPAVCAARALRRVDQDKNGQWPGKTSELDEYGVRVSATHIAFAFSQLFNSAEGTRVISRYIVRQKSRLKPFQGVLKYCAEGGLQAVLDEYLYMLKPTCKSIEDAVATICNTTLSPSWVSAQPSLSGKDVQLRCHYAIALGTQKMETEEGLKRVTSVRESFNSPFRPFVLTSTSIGQEGLDFHWYCSEVVHWNLPSNPIDLEQREGRVNRFQSLVVRRRAVELLASRLASDESWNALFDKAVNHFSGQPGSTDLTPYWHVPEGSSKIKRVVPMLPLSREVHRYAQMLKILSLYRLAFGQPRQQELLEYLLGLNLSPEEETELKGKLIVNLAPIIYTRSHLPN